LRFRSGPARAMRLSVAATISSYVASSAIPSSRCSLARSSLSLRDSLCRSFSTFHGSFLNGLGTAVVACRRSEWDDGGADGNVRVDDAGATKAWADPAS
jgi:hypothetical protein